MSGCWALPICRGRFRCLFHHTYPLPCWQQQPSLNQTGSNHERKDIRKTILANKCKRKTQQRQIWMGAFGSKNQPHDMCRAPGEGQTGYPSQKDGQLCSVLREEILYPFIQSRTGIPPGTGGFRTLLLHRVTYRLQFLLALQSGLWTRGRTLQTDPTTKHQPYPPNIVSVTAVPLTRVFLARFSNLKDTLGKISSYDKVILSLLCCSRYTSPWFSST